MAEFRIPNRILYGEGTAEQLGILKGQRLLLVYDNPAAAQLAQKYLSPCGMVIRTLEADPDFIDISQVMEGAKALMEFKPEWVLAAGGHGAMDLAKLIRVFYQHPGLSTEDVIQGEATDIPLSKTRLIALPVYNTNGGEASCTAYLANASSGGESEIRNPAFMPNMTIIDPNMLPCSEDRAEALCVMSTFLLAIEASADPNCSSFARPMALESISIIAKSVLAHSYAPSLRSPLLYAQCLAGISHTNSVPGLCSALCRVSALTFGPASLGGLGAVFLPAVIRQDKHQDKYLPAARAMGLKDAAALADAVQEYADMLGLPLYLKEMEVGKNTFLKILSKLSHRVLSVLPPNALPDKEPQKYVEQILRAAYSPKEQQNAQ